MFMLLNSTPLFWNFNLLFIMTLTELMSLSVSIVPLIRKKKLFTTSSLEERGGDTIYQSIMLIAQSSKDKYTKATFVYA